jgi:hypothetical protein
MVVEKIVTLDRRSLNYNCGMELFLITFNIVVSTSGFSFIAWRQRDTRQILREQKELMDRMDANSSRIVDHSRHIAELVVQNGSILARGKG